LSQALEDAPLQALFAEKLRSKKLELQGVDVLDPFFSQAQVAEEEARLPPG